MLVYAKRRCYLRILPISNNNTKSVHPGFKTKLPPANCRYGNYWNILADNCVIEGKYDVLKNLAGKLKNNNDTNILALSAHCSTENKLSKDVYSFFLCRADDLRGNADSINLTSVPPLHGKLDYVVKRNQYGEIVEQRIDSNLLKNDKATSTEILLDMLNQIVSPNTKENSFIFGQK